jgi:hypothetical protein
MLALVATALIALTATGLQYYLTPIESRPFHQDYQTMKPSGTYSHGLGILGALMIITGVSTYSTRKRVRALWQIGKLNRWLEFHIFNCLLGPVLIVYHSTFKVGGIAAIAFWTMLSVAASGIVGRFLYALIPRNINGTELTLDEIERQLAEIRNALASTPIGARLVELTDNVFSQISPPKNLTETVATLFRLHRTKARVLREVDGIVRTRYIMMSTTRSLVLRTKERVSLIQKSIVLSQVERIFFYWHAIHLPFTIIMFITLAAHITVVLLLGYTWVF